MFLFVLAVVTSVALVFGLIKVGEEWINTLSFSDQPYDEIDYPPLLEAIIYGETERVEQLLQEGADPNERSEFGESTLIIAIDHGHSEFVPSLLEYGADPNIQDDYGWTALISTILMEDLETAQILLDTGANPSLENEEGLSALDYAIEFGYEEFIEVLTQAE